jgi:hypothetical protein
MEASYATELQWVGQDKRDAVSCDVVHWVEVVKDRGQGGMEGKSTSYKIVENLTKMADLLPRHQVLLVLEKAASPPLPPKGTGVSQKGVLNSLSGSGLTRLMR